MARLHLWPNTVLRALSAEENGCKPAADGARRLLPGSLHRAGPGPRARFCSGATNLQTRAPFSTFLSQVRLCKKTAKLHKGCGVVWGGVGRGGSTSGVFMFNVQNSCEVLRRTTAEGLHRAPEVKLFLFSSQTDQNPGGPSTTGWTFRFKTGALTNITLLCYIYLVFQCF